MASLFRRLIDKISTSNEPKPFEGPLNRNCPHLLPARASGVHYPVADTDNADFINNPATSSSTYTGNDHLTKIQQGARVLTMDIDPILNLVAVAVIVNNKSLTTVTDFLNYVSSSKSPNNNNNNNNNNNQRTQSNPNQNNSKPVCDVAVFPLGDCAAPPLSASTPASTCQWLFSDDPTCDAKTSVHFVDAVRWIPGTGCLGVLANRGQFLLFRLGFDVAEPAFMHVSDRSHYYTAMVPLCHSVRLTHLPTLFLGSAGGAVVCAKVNRDNVATLSSDLCVLNQDPVKAVFGDGNFCVSHIVHCHYDHDLILVAYSTAHDVESQKGKYAVGFILWSLTRKSSTNDAKAFCAGVPLAGFVANPQQVNNQNNFILVQTLAFTVHWHNDYFNEANANFSSKDDKSTDVSSPAITCMSADGRILCFKNDSVLCNNSASAVDPNYPLGKALRFFCPTSQIPSSSIFPPNCRISPKIKCFSHGVKPNRCTEPVHQLHGTTNQPFPCQIYLVEYEGGDHTMNPSSNGNNLENTLYASSSSSPMSASSSSPRNNNDCNTSSHRRHLVGIAVRISANGNILFGTTIGKTHFSSSFKSLLGVSAENNHNNDFVTCSVVRNDFENDTNPNSFSSIIPHHSWQQSHRDMFEANRSRSTTWFGTSFCLNNNGSSSGRGFPFKCADLYIDLTFDKKNSVVAINFAPPVERMLPDSSSFSVFPMLLVNEETITINDEEKVSIVNNLRNQHRQKVQQKQQDDRDDADEADSLQLFNHYCRNPSQIVVLGTAEAYDQGKTTWHHQSTSSCLVDSRSLIKSPSRFVATARRRYVKSSASSCRYEIDKNSIRISRWNPSLDCVFGIPALIQLPEIFSISSYFAQKGANEDGDDEDEQQEVNAYFDSISALISCPPVSAKNNSNTATQAINKPNTRNRDDDDDDDQENDNFEKEDLSLQHSVILILKGSMMDPSAGTQQVLLALKVSWDSEGGAWKAAKVAESCILSKNNNNKEESMSKSIALAEDDVTCFRIFTPLANENENSNFNNTVEIIFATQAGALVHVTMDTKSTSPLSTSYKTRVILPPNVLTNSSTSSSTLPPILAISNKILGPLASGNSSPTARSNNNNSNAKTPHVCVITHDFRIVVINANSGSIVHTVQLFTSPPSANKTKIDFDPLQISSTPGSIPVKIDVFENRLATVEFMTRGANQNNAPSQSSSSPSNSNNNKVVSIDLTETDKRLQVFTRLPHGEFHFCQTKPNRSIERVRFLSRYSAVASSSSSMSGNNNSCCCPFDITSTIQGDELVLTLLTPGLQSIKSRVSIPLPRGRMSIITNNNSVSYSVSIIPHLVLSQNELHVLVSISPNRIPVACRLLNPEIPTDGNDTSSLISHPYFGLSSKEELFHIVFPILGVSQSTTISEDQKYETARLLAPLQSLWNTSPMSGAPSIFLPDFVSSRQARATRNAVSRESIGFGIKQKFLVSSLSTPNNHNQNQQKREFYYSSGLLCALPFEEEQAAQNNSNSNTSQDKKPGFFGKLFGASTRVGVFSRVQDLTQYLHLNSRVKQQISSFTTTGSGRNARGDDASFDAFIQNVASTTDNEEARRRLLLARSGGSANANATANSNNRVNNTNNALAGARNEMAEARQMLQERGENIERVQDKSRDLAAAAQAFEENAKKLSAEKKGFWNF